MSLPSWERGLKSCFTHEYSRRETVAPLVGARIEILRPEEQKVIRIVAPLVGARIEISA